MSGMGAAHLKSTKERVPDKPEMQEMEIPKSLPCARVRRAHSFLDNNPSLPVSGQALRSLQSHPTLLSPSPRKIWPVPNLTAFLSRPHSLQAPMASCCSAKRPCS